MLGRSFASLLIALVCQSAAVEAQTAANDWTPFRNERYGFSLSYPADVFALERTSDAGMARSSCLVTAMHGCLLVSCPTRTD